ncbi:hypothetical protein [Rhizobium binxianense]
MAEASTRQSFVIEFSTLSGPYVANGTSVIVEIFRHRGGDGRWFLQVIDEGLDATIWEDPFVTDTEAFEQFLATVEAEGIESFAASPAKPLH